MSARASIWEGEFKIAGVAIKCFVLDDGERVIEAESFNRFLQAVEDGATIMPAEMLPFVRWQNSEGVS